MTDAEIEQTRKSLEAPPEPLYVDSKAKERSDAVVAAMYDAGIFPSLDAVTELEELLAEIPYIGNGSFVRPFETIAEARAVQQPGQDLIITGYARIGSARQQ